MATRIATTICRALAVSPGGTETTLARQATRPVPNVQQTSIHPVAPVRR